MAWVKLDDGFFTNPKVARVGAEAKLLYLSALAYSARELTDGAIDGRHIPLIAVMADVKKPLVAAQKLVEVGLWDRDDDADSYRIHDYLTFNSSRDSVLEKRGRDLERKRNPRGIPMDSNAPRVRASRPQSQSSSIEDSPQPPAGEAKRVTPAFIEEMVTEWGPKYRGGEAKCRSRIEDAMNNTASAHWKNQRLGLRKWLRRDVEEFDYGVNSPIPLQANSRGSFAAVTGGARDISELDDLVRPSGALR